MRISDKIIASALLAAGTLAFLSPSESQAAQAQLQAKGRVPAAALASPVAPDGPGSAQSPLDVRGQSRSWSRMVRARGERDTVNFVQTRKNYRAEIESIRF